MSGGERPKGAKHPARPVVPSLRARGLVMQFVARCLRFGYVMAPPELRFYPRETALDKDGTADDGYKKCHRMDDEDYDFGCHTFPQVCLETSTKCSRIRSAMACSSAFESPKNSRTMRFFPVPDSLW